MVEFDHARDFSHSHSSSLDHRQASSFPYQDRLVTYLSLLSGSDGYLYFSSGSLFGLLSTLSSLESVPLSLQVSTPYLDFDFSLPGLDFAAAAGSRSPFYSPEP